MAIDTGGGATAGSGNVAAAVAADWEPVKPTVGQAQEAYQVLYELSKRHPEDTELAEALEHARLLRDQIWAEHDAKRKALL